MKLFNNKKILVIGAHADDEVLGCGGTIARLAAHGITVDVLIITDSVSSQYETHQELGSIDTRRQSGLQLSCKRLGVSSVYQFDFPDMRLDTVAHIDLNKSIEQHLAKYEYDVVLTHHGKDVNKDHQCVFESVLVACRPTPAQSVKMLMTYNTPSSTEWGMISSECAFIPNFFIDISKTIVAKVEALKAYEDELRDFPHPRSEENIINLAATVGASVGVHAAEGFCIIRGVI